MIIFIKGPIATLNYFLNNMNQKIEDSVVLDICDKDYKQALSSIDEDIDENTIVITFNNVGINILANDQFYWDLKQVKLYNILVDPPQWFTQVFDLQIRSMTTVVVDRQHCDFIHKYYPKQKCSFLPHGGVRLTKEEIPYHERRMDVAYFANNKESVTLNTDIERMMYDLLIKYPKMTLDDIYDLFLKDQNLKFDLKQERELLELLYENTFYAVKDYFQKKIIMEIANAGIDLHIYGKNWEGIAGGFPNNVKLHGEITPQECIEKMKNCKIVLNMQPWFKDGAHERIFNAMLNGVVCFTDESKYLKERFIDMDNIVFYQLDHLDALVDKIKMILEHPLLAEKIIDNQKKTAAHDTWRDRLDEILLEGNGHTEQVR
ncbi:MAG: glycosyltransferase [Lachnospiraceae bacterium]|nr:glycosyltransferase [Lachnospiraceae bacterium]